MTVRELKQEIAALEPEARDEISTYLIRLRSEQKPSSGWRAAFGKAAPSEIEELDQVIGSEFEQIDRDTWK